MDRSRAPKSGKKAASWGDFEAALKAGKFEADQGAKLHVLLTPTNSPSVVRLRGLIKARLPKATFRAYSPIHEGNIRQGAKLAYGAVIQPVFAYDKAGVVLSLDCDFLQTEAGSVRANKGFATGRRPVVGAPMNRLYVVEPTLTTTGAAADHRVRVAATDVERVALALAAHIAALRVPLGPLGTAADKLAKLGVGDAAISEKWLKAVAKDLVNNRGRALIVAGSRQPARVHALVHALNDALGNAGQTVTFASVLDPEEADPIADIAALAKDMADGKVGTLLILGGNPVYDAPADLKFAEALAKVQVSVHLAMSEDETGERCTWQLPRAHEYEAWGDQRALDGTVSVQQPLITPLFDGRSEIEVLSLLAAGQESTGYDIVRATVRADLLAAHGLSACGAAGVDGKVDCRDVQDNKVPFRVADLDRDWKRALAEGVVRRGVPSGPRGSVRMADVAAAFEKSSTSAPVSKDSLEVVFVPCSKLFDGRHANNVWLQELPDPITKLVWDNAALVSPKTAKELGLKNGDVVKLTRGERSISVGVWLNPGQANNSIAIALGWGRKKAGRIGNGKGFDAYPLRTTDAAHVAT
ncbi:MAG: 4Fe-4S ferredoxin, partial [Myxococcales bacterium]